MAEEPSSSGSRRLSFPTSASDFALPGPSSNSSESTEDSQRRLLLRLRRPALTTKNAPFGDKPIHSPLAISFTASRRGSQFYGEESESDKERMWSESSPSSSSGNPTPPIVPVDEEESNDGRQSQINLTLPSTPPPNRGRTGSKLLDPDLETPGTARPRRHIQPKPSRLLSLQTESRPEDNEVQSEAAFQRLIASYPGLPMQPRTPRAPSDRGRYPEEAGHEESQREDTPSDDEVEGLNSVFAYEGPSEPINILKPCTPAPSVNGDDMNMSIAGSPIIGAMDIDAPLASPSVMSTPMSMSYWRYTPPPTTSAVRSNKRKFDERYDPYPTAAKRRAVSPSVAHLRDSYSNLASYPRTPNNRPPVPIPLSMPASSMSSGTSSPTISSSYSLSMAGTRQMSFGPMSVTSSPILRPSIGLSSPILRPIPRTRRPDGEEREVDGAGEGVNGLTLNN
ncbi:hypothetical protein CONPUDRAFT_86845 [Coniophora puteana RWD-64-598 SS2]|uniref:Uncharacterized protein n=1 Tax=Coniophora puteana (strain RWD-64-598) TaxID=741705 RepID=A0A5M3N645_CONPW|nr:uncharacterized protein CONPUDRAFT_86845 [Coniophora puteana RWD-64-598 SS2]EIW86910.1 hypothetical protein CONPUDRAFT_86845 [Coniophora puteana RWD-64-598 SS2]